MFANAGWFVDRHTMVWIRKINTSVEQLWDAVSTKKGLERWWIVDDIEIELCVGGTFRHHWTDTVRGFRKNEFIDFDGRTFSGSRMRFEMREDGDGCVFSFLCKWREDATPEKTVNSADLGAVQPGGPGTPWASVAAGWHEMIDQLEAYLTTQAFEDSYEELIPFYARYLTDYYRWVAEISR